HRADQCRVEHPTSLAAGRADHHGDGRLGVGGGGHGRGAWYRRLVPADEIWRQLLAGNRAVPHDALCARHVVLLRRASARARLEVSVKIGLSGGARLKAKLEEIRADVGSGDVLRLGFLEGATYPDGTNVAYAAAINEWGGTFQVGEREQTIYRKVGKDGAF